MTDRYAHLRLPTPEATKVKMSAAKLGRKYSPEHKLNMRVSQILKRATEAGACPVDRVINSPRYTEEEKAEILLNIRGRDIELEESALVVLDGL